MIFRSFVQAALLSTGVLSIGLVSGAAELLFTPIGFSVVLVTFFLEIFGNRW